MIVEEKNHMESLKEKKKVRQQKYRQSRSDLKCKEDKEKDKTGKKMARQSRSDVKRKEDNEYDKIRMRKMS